MNKDQFRHFIVAWNTLYPLDRWWRLKYKVSFNSPTHREVNQLDIIFEYEEDVLFHTKPKEQDDDDEQFFKPKYIPGKGLVVNSREQEVTEIPDWFKNMEKMTFDEEGGLKMK
jgi:hypothetical protein